MLACLSSGLAEAWATGYLWLRRATTPGQDATDWFLRQLFHGEERLRRGIAALLDWGWAVFRVSRRGRDGDNPPTRGKESTMSGYME